MRTIQRDIAGAFIFSKDGLILLGKTRKGGVYKDLWIVPGGGVHEGESYKEAAKREVKEETGLVVDDSQLEAIPGKSKGTSTKVLKDTGEEVKVEMTFWDFKVTLPDNAEDVVLSLDDDLSEAKFFTLEELKNIELGGGIYNSLKEMGFVI